MKLIRESRDVLISVCVCTYNRSAILAHCLNSLGQLKDPRPEHEVEIIVVDNNSRDETAATVKSLIPRFPFEMRYVFEPQQGISAARNRAISEARGDYLAFLDDECIVSPDWLSAAISDISEFHPCIIGGPYIGAFLPGNRPRWFKAEYGNAYFLDYQYRRGFQVGFRASGGNMIVRRDVLSQFKFDVSMGPKAGKLKLGEEIDLQERFFNARPSERVFYEPQLLVRHFILPTKMRLSYRAKRVFIGALAKSEGVGLAELLFGLIKTLVRMALLPVAVTFRNRSKYPFWQNYVYERAIPATCSQLGILARYVRDRPGKGQETKMAV